MKIKIGLYGIGLETYWNQFDGLLDRLQGWQQTIADRIIEDHPDVEVVNTGIVDNPTKAREVGQLLAQSNIELILLYVSTYALSSTVLPVVLRARVPVIVLNLQATNAIDYDK
ncbi:MAG: arabinose isomerase, partial [Candidatus Latescibacteria bacterium]|nr:arabinose isomerase [Candidatus Latescibacterota bacterium]